MLPTTQAPEKASAPVRAPAGAAWTRWSLLVLELAVLAFVVREILRQALAIAHRVAAPFQFDYEEGNILNALSRILHGLSPYPDPHAFPSVLNPYGPVAYYLLAIPVKLFGLSFGHARVMIVASVAAICVLLALTIVRRGGLRLAAVAFGLMFPTLAVVQGWTWLLRVDFLALAVTLAGLYAFCRSNSEGPELPSTDHRAPTTDYRRPRSHWFSAAFFVAAILVKYTFLAAPAACLLYLLLQRRWKEAARFAAVVVALSGTALAVAAGLTRGTVITHLFLSHPDPFYWQAYLLRTSHVLAMHRPLVALAGLLLVHDLRHRKLSVPVSWLLLATGTAITSGKLGSSWNHYLEWSAALCLCAGLGFSLLTQLKPRSLAVAATAAAALWVSAFVLQRQRPPDPFLAVQDCPRAYAFVKEQAGETVLSENVGALVLAGKTVWVSNPYVLTQMVTRAGWSDKPLTDMVRQRRFQAILLNLPYPSYRYFLDHGTDRFSPQLLRAIGENYRVGPRFQCQDAAFVYLPVN